ncbi:hypothetical protein QYF61_007017 [Mycteria americana]|uniref:RNA-directed DNA polymerase from mobile element jockey n=1 Tax=Mycteria americana TaxID=33587 RepID=A0AAN7MGW1_MYCAM|nr:hypothetical protein QYF61_007017 [Mycteria americana]
MAHGVPTSPDAMAMPMDMFSVDYVDRKLSVPVCSQFSKESRRELVQRSCTIQLQPSVEKSDVRKSDASPRWLMRELLRLGRSWLLGEVPEDWKEANVNPVSKRGKKEDLGSCQPVSSSILLDALMKYSLDKWKLRWTEN